jgi:tRNA nucleotidyltransferase (CCA-adding enzyme)
MTMTDDHMTEDLGEASESSTGDLPGAGNSGARAESQAISGASAKPQATVGEERIGAPTQDGEMVLERVRHLPGGSELLRLAVEHPGRVELVGGAVRDIMLGSRPHELDVIVESDVEQLAGRLASVLGGEATLYERFGTAVVQGGSASIDIATIRAEGYSAPGALPDVRPGSPEEDLERRDFTVNAIAVALAGERPGEVRAVAGALEDLAAHRLRVLHDASFLEDPTRILRLARYTARLGFTVDSHTAELAQEALAAGALKTVSGERLGAEARLAFDEAEPLAPLAELDRMGVFAAWEPGVSFDEHMTRTALEVMPDDGSKRVLLAASLLYELSNRLDQEETEPAMRGFVYDLELPSGDGERVFGVAVNAAFAIDHVDYTETTAELLELMLDTPVESLALAAAVRDIEDGPRSYGRRMIEEWLNEQRHITPQLTGDDLIAAGVPEGPEVGMRLEEAYRLLLEERIEPGRETELRAALEARI